MKQKLYKSGVALSLLIIVAGVVTAQSQPSTSARDSNTNGTISGKVVSDNGQPLANAIVFVRPFGATQSGRDTSTDNEGNFRISGLDPVAYIVTASLPAYVATPRDPDINPNAFYKVGDFARIELIKGGVITGSVTNASGEPVVAVPVRAYLVRDNTGNPPRYSAPFRERTTDDRGFFRIYGLPMGTYVVAAGGGSISRNSLSAYSGDAPTFSPSSTREGAIEVNVHPGEETTNVDIRYRGDRGHVVGGSVNSAMTSDLNSGSFVILSSIFGGTSQTNYSSYQSIANREFYFDGLADGDYYLTTEAFALGHVVAISESRRVKVNGADITGIELIAKPLGSIAGRIVLEDSKGLECSGKQRPLVGEIPITAWHNEKMVAKDQPQFPWALGEPSTPDNQGGFTLRSLAPGQYRFNARTTAKHWYLKSITWPSGDSNARNRSADRIVDAARNWTNIKSGDRLSGLTITVAEGAASFSGTIDVGEDGKRPPKLIVYLVPAERDKGDDVLRFFATVVSADGSFAIDNVAPGHYWAITKAVDQNDPNVLSSLRLPDETAARAKLLTDAEASKIEIELKPCANVTEYKLSFQMAK